MEENSTTTLFHYTKSLARIKHILKDGIRATYCKEKILENIFGIPMISFCDIPISRTGLHREKYGNYAIGLDKEKALANRTLKGLLNPVIYCASQGLANSIVAFLREGESLDCLTESIYNDFNNPDAQIFEHIKPSFEKIASIKSTQYKFLAYDILAYTKHYSGEHKWKKVIYYNEHEWRVVMRHCSSFGEETYRWLNEEEYQKWRGNEKSKKELFKECLFSDEDYINHIIVKTEKEIPELIDYIWSLNSIMKREVDDNQKRLLTSRITSFERIEKDY
jgi:hypothetical protein